MQVSIDSIRKTAVDFLAVKYGEEIAIRTVEVLLWADCAGISSQGLAKLTGTTPLQNVPLQYGVKTERDSPVSKLLDGGGNPAPYVAQLATDAAIEKASSQGVSIVGIRNCFSSNGAQSFYLNKIAEQGLVGIMCSSSPASVAPFGSAEALFGTNPAAFGFPSLNNPVLFDMATSAMTWYGLVLAAARGETLPPGVAIDEHHNPTTDARSAMEGALVPFGDSAKGSGLGLAVQLLAGPLVGAPYGKEWDSEWGGDDHRNRSGHFFR